MRPEPKVFRVALDTPLRRLFDYLPPALPATPHRPAPGVRVRVPFGRQRLVGVVLGSADTSEVPPGRLRPILEVLDPKPVLDAAALELLGWAARYYHHPIGEVLAGALPRPLRLGASATGSEERWVATGAGT
ncbi:MAG TPA: primosomal protein N', partial [Steroidobacteraceae bacterium]|nr:primosomal protein N' [Steroidobacteraceae bacterium]